MPESDVAPNRYLVAIATYRRRGELERLLDSLLQSLSGHAVDVLVIDNDAAQSARSVARDHPLQPKYVVEPDPGIPSARNHALQAFTEEYAGLLFVDDDESVDIGWFSSITRYSEHSGAGIVYGAIVSSLPSDAPWWTKAGCYQRPIPETGTELDWAGTGNLLITRPSWIAAGSPQFDQRYRVVGGSDADFTKSLYRVGTTIRFCAEAVVYEHVPASRISGAWILRRHIRTGVSSTLHIKKFGDQRVFYALFHAAAALTVGLAELAFDFAFRRGPKRRSLVRFGGGIGVILGLIGGHVHEYRRADLACPKCARSTLDGDRAHRP